METDQSNVKVEDYIKKLKDIKIQKASLNNDILEKYCSITEIGMLLDLTVLYLEKSIASLKENSQNPQGKKTAMSSGIEGIRGVQDSVGKISVLWGEIASIDPQTNFTTSSEIANTLPHYDYGRQVIILDKIKLLTDKFNEFNNINHLKLHISMHAILDLEFNLLNGYKNLLNYKDLSQLKLSQPFYYEKEKIIKEVVHLMNDLALSYKECAEKLSIDWLISKAIKILEEKRRLESVFKMQSEKDNTKKTIETWKKEL